MKCVYLSIVIHLNNNHPYNLSNLCLDYLYNFNKALNMVNTKFHLNNMYRHISYNYQVMYNQYMKQDNLFVIIIIVNKILNLCMQNFQCSIPLNNQCIQFQMYMIYMEFSMYYIMIHSKNVMIHKISNQTILLMCMISMGIGTLYIEILLNSTQIDK